MLVIIAYALDDTKARQAASVNWEDGMQNINATPPADFPAQVIMMDKELGQRHPTKAFYLRVTAGNGTEHIDLDDAVTPLDARSMARVKGYEPTHWMEVGDRWPMMF